jgi:hypothetical protein
MYYYRGRFYHGSGEEELAMGFSPLSGVPEVSRNIRKDLFSEIHQERPGLAIPC